MTHLLSGGLWMAALMFATPLMAGAQQDDAATVITMERAALDRSDNGDPMGFLEISDDDVVYIDTATEKPIQGIAALREYYKGFPKGHNPGRMTNVRVQRLGDNVAALTYNYVGQKGLRNGWNCTEVYRKTPRGWRIVHTHWSYVKSQPVDHD